MSNKKKKINKEQAEQTKDSSKLDENLKSNEDESKLESKDDNEAKDTENLEQEIDYYESYVTLNDKYVRLVAEYDNFRKRSRKEKDALYNASLIDVCKAWLPVLDNLDRAIEALDKLESSESKQMSEGIEMVRKQAYETMEQLGVSEIKSLGEPFDPEFHEAVAHVENPEYGENEIFEVVKKGYIKDDTVIRHSVVCVAN
ncbi:MAG: nucleotide exchange factor GrpE [Clostridiaceae bacterium]|mgnify:CR=1 FL=1|nr:nucleotide exchange factor GrpE [Clostridiaceae bacterium]